MVPSYRRQRLDMCRTFHNYISIKKNQAINYPSSKLDNKSNNNSIQYQLVLDIAYLNGTIWAFEKLN